MFTQNFIGNIIYDLNAVYEKYARVVSIFMVNSIHAPKKQILMYMSSVTNRCMLSPVQSQSKFIFMYCLLP